ncbi:MAG: hypothetical protein GY774_10065 [Planctomycetes bacterium]|nr:hypothetical protein [Planctomycetota bacterium]
MSNEEKPQVPEEPQQTAPEESQQAAPEEPQEDVSEEQSSTEPKIGFGDATEQSSDE